MGDLIADLYEIRDVVRSGGMGLVYRVWHVSWLMDLALKVPRPELVASTGGAARFTAEAETWADLGAHPHVVACAYVRSIDGRPAVFAEWVDGGNLADAVASGRLYADGPAAGLARTLDVAIQCAWGLEYAHRRGLVHQDVKPANVMLTRDGLVKVTDFGLAGARAVAGESSADVTGGSVLVGYGGLTQAYCSPEQAVAALRPGVRLGRATDVWSWAVTVLEMFRGTPPCRFGQTAGEVLAAIVAAGVAEPSLPALPDPVAQLLARCFTHDPVARPRDLGALAEELAGHYRELVGRPYPRTRPDPIALDADGISNQALSMLDLGQAERAERLWGQALAADARHREAVINRGLHEWRTGRATDMRLVSEFEAIRSGDPLVDGALVHLHLERGDPAGAASVLIDAGLHAEAAAVERLRGPEPIPLAGCPDGVNAVALGADGGVAVTGGTDHAVRVWDATSGRCRHVLLGHRFTVTAVAVCATGDTVVSGDRGGCVRVWDLRATPETRFGLTRAAPVDAVALSPDGRRALAGWTDGTVQAWDVPARGGLHVPSAGSAPVIDRAMPPARTATPGERWVAIATDGRLGASWLRKAGEVLVWDLESGTARYVMRRQHARVAFAVDASMFLAEDVDGSASRFEVASGRLLGGAPRHPCWSGPVATAGVPVALVGGVEGRTVRVTELDSGRCLSTLPIDPAAGLAISADGRVALVGGTAGTPPTVIHVPVPKTVSPWRYCRPRGAAQLIADQEAVDAAVAEADLLLGQGRLAAAAEVVRSARRVAGHRNDSVLLRRWRTAAAGGRRADLLAAWLARRERADAGPPVAVCAETGVAVCGGHDGRLEVVDLVSGTRREPLVGHRSAVRAAVLLADGQSLLTGDADGCVRWWSLPDSRCLARFDGRSGPIVALAASADGRVGLACGHGPVVRMLDLTVGAEHTIDTGVGWVRALALSPDGTHAVTATSEIGRRTDARGAQVWRLADKTCLGLLGGSAERFGDVEDVAIAPDGRQVVCDYHGEVDVWQLDIGRRGPRLAICRGPFRICPDSRRAVTGDAENAVTVWDLLAGRLVHTMPGHRGPLTAVAVAADSSFAVTGATDETLRIWDLATGTWLCTLPGDAGVPTHLDVSSDGHRVVSASADELSVFELDWDYEFPADLGRDQPGHRWGGHTP